MIYGPNANPSFKATIATDGQEFKLGNLTIIALHTPGHTMESTTYLLRDAEGKDTAIFSGDTLFLGDVGRPDLAQKAATMTQEDLAGILFDSLRNKIMPLADDITVYPAHGAGSACGKNMSKETVGNLGDQKSTNYALRADMTKDEFIAEVTDGLLAPPAYFPLNVKMNKEGYVSIDEVIKKGDVALSASAFEAAANEIGAVVLDVRHQDKFVVEHVPNSIFIGIEGGFAPWVGALIKDVEQPILLIVEDDAIEEAITRLSRVGFDNILGYLDGGLENWKKEGKEVESLESISADQFAAQVEKDGRKIFDVRKPGEWDTEHLPDAENTSLGELNNHLAEFPKEDRFYIHCAGGYRSVIAASILKSRGIHNMIDVKGGFDAIKKTEMKTSTFVCPNS
ncbi:MAG: hydroxyacylglutathione hydrolase [Pseudomonadales bacterium]